MPTAIQQPGCRAFDESDIVISLQGLQGSIAGSNSHRCASPESWFYRFWSESPLL